MPTEMDPTSILINCIIILLSAKPKLSRTGKNKTLKDDFARFEHLAKRVAELSESRVKYENELEALIETMDNSELKLGIHTLLFLLRNAKLLVSEIAAKITAQEKLYEDTDREYFSKARSLAKLKREWRKEIVESYLQEASTKYLLKSLIK